MVVDLVTEQQVLARIAAQASTPLERLLRDLGREVDLSDPHLQARLERLYTQVGAANEETRDRWLARYGLNHAQVAVMFSSSCWDGEVPLPAWIETLDEILHGFDGGSQPQDRCLLSDEPLPFEELLLPFVLFARQRLTLHAPEENALLSSEALVSLERWLLMQLSEQAAQALYVAFYHFRAQRVPHQYDWQERTTQRSLYQVFVEQYQGERMLPFLQHYSVLARLLVLLVEQWIENTHEFLQRLAFDRPYLAQHFHDKQDIGQVAEIIPGCSDRHHDGRTVWLLTFCSGLRLVYKPRCLKVEEAFFGWLACINAAGFTLPLKEIRVLSRNAYGWMEYVEHAPCQSMQEVQHYYQRAGGLACLLYVLGTTDIHIENLIANGEHPVVVDVEVYNLPHRLDFSPQRASSNGLIGGNTFIEHSVLSSGLLPGSMCKPYASQVIDVSALGEMTEQVSSIRWMHRNTDAMSLSQVTTDRQMTANKVVLNGITIRSGDYDEEIITGFRHMYRFLREHWDELLTPEGPLSHFAGCPIRVVWRATAIYAKLLKRLTHPKFLRDGADRWIELCIFEKPLLQAGVSSACWRLVETEVSSLEQLDVPFFLTRTDCLDLWADRGNKFADIFVRSAQEQRRLFLMRLSEEDMEHQIEIMRSSLQEPGSARGLQDYATAASSEVSSSVK